MAMQEKGKTTRRSEGQWRRLVSKFSGSGMGVDEFCQRQGISGASFYRWRNLLGASADDGTQVGSKIEPAFVDLGTVSSVPKPRPSLELKLDLGDGLMLHLVRS